MSTPDLDDVLARIRANVSAFADSLNRHSSEESRGKGFAFDVQLLEERDDVAAALVKDITTIDEGMSERRVFNSPAPSEWRTERLTDEQFEAAKADWPELGMFDDATVRQVADVLGIRMVRELARQAVKHAPAVLEGRDSRG